MTRTLVVLFLAAALLTVAPPAAGATTRSCPDIKPRFTEPKRIGFVDIRSGVRCSAARDVLLAWNRHIQRTGGYEPYRWRRWRCRLSQGTVCTRGTRRIRADMVLD